MRAEPLLLDFARNLPASRSISDSASPGGGPSHRHFGTATPAEEQSGRTPSAARLESAVVGSPSSSLVGGDPDVKTIRATLICMATGLGKTKTASAFIKRWLGHEDWHTGLRPYQRDDVEAAWQQLTGGAPDGLYRGRVLWMVTGDELCEQAKNELHATLGEWIGLERAEHHARGERVVVGSVPTLKGARLKGWHPRTFTLVVIDEAHHAPSVRYLNIVKHFDEAKVVGLSATPKRHDKKSQRLVFQDWVKPVRPIPWGVAHGYLVPFVPVGVYIDGVDLSQVGSVAGDLNLDELEAEILKSVAAITRETFERVGTRRTLIYTPGVGSAHAVAKCLNVLRPGCARAVDGETPRDARKELLAAHRRDDYQFLVNCLVLKEGYDDRMLRAIVIARPTKSKPLYIQMAGRGGRTSIPELTELSDRLSAISASAKSDCMLIDITGHAGRHNLISAVDLDGRYDDKQKARAKEILAKNPGQHLDKALQDAAKQLKAEEDARREREARVAAQAKVRARTGTWDPFETFRIERPIGDEAQWSAAPLAATDVEWLGKNGLPTEGMTHGEAMKLRRTAAAWRKAGLANFKQRKVLKRHQLPENVYFYKASALIDAIARNGWHTPPAHEVTAILASGRQAGAEG